MTGHDPLATVTHMEIQKVGSFLEWKGFLKTYRVPAGPNTKFGYSSVNKLVYVADTIDGELEVSVYDTKAFLLDARTYSYKIIDIIEKDGSVYMHYINRKTGEKLSGMFARSAGLTSISELKD